MKGCLNRNNFIPRAIVFTHTRLMLELLPKEVSGPLVLSALFHDVGKPVTGNGRRDRANSFNEHDRIGAAMTESIMERLRFSRAEIDAVVEMVRQHMVFKDVPKMRVAKLNDSWRAQPLKKSSSCIESICGEQSWADGPIRVLEKR